ncbi:MAG: hypothetical protein AVDCRST_MAG88-2948, partial [uncultured Thermomicrobiales bacterium]
GRLGRDRPDERMQSELPALLPADAGGATARGTRGRNDPRWARCRRGESRRRGERRPPALPRVARPLTRARRENGDHLQRLQPRAPRRRRTGRFPLGRAEFRLHHRGGDEPIPRPRRLAPGDRGAAALPAAWYPHHDHRGN